MRVATFNIKHATRADGKVDNRELIRSCAGLDADVLGLQEVDRHRSRTHFRDQAAFVARRLGYRVEFHTVIRHGTFRGQYGNALLARGAIDDVDRFTLPRPSARQKRGALIARVTHEGSPVTVAVTHLQHHPRGLPEAEREAPTQFHALLARVALRSGPFVVMGDLNLGPPRAGPVLLGAGFDIAPLEATFPRDEPRVTLDYVAVQGLTIRGAEVAATTISDHCAVVVTLGHRSS